MSPDSCHECAIRLNPAALCNPRLSESSFRQAFSARLIVSHKVRAESVRLYQARITNPRAMWLRTNQIIPNPGISDTTVIAMTSPISV